MALPNPLPDNPLRWDGWKNYNSDNLYERLCLEFDANVTSEQIEENCRTLLVWWQKKLPLKNQPSNPLAQLLRGGLDDAPVFLVEARTELLDPTARARIDAELRAQAVLVALEEFKKILGFVLVDQKLTPEAEERLLVAGAALGLSRQEMLASLETELTKLGAQRATAPAPPVAAPRQKRDPGPEDATGEFRRMLRLSRLAIDGDDMTDDQRDALCNMGEGLGLTGGQAEDLIDEYLEEMSNAPAPAFVPATARAAAKPTATTAPRPAQVPAATARAPAPVAPVVVREPFVNVSPLARAQEKHKYPKFTTRSGSEMLLVTSGVFVMGSDSRDATPQEQPLTRVSISRFFMARHPVTNEQYELFDPAHRAKRAPGAAERHPVVYVTSREAEKFCAWLSQREGRRFRLPTEAEWEYAARGTDGRIYPWGELLDAGHYANFADSRTGFAWRDATIDDGFAESSPVGSYPRGASPFGIEDLAGNVFEWCHDFFEEYKGKERVNPRGPMNGSKRVYRGGSWKSRVSSLRASARQFNLPDYSSNDVGFRIVCECED